MKTHLPLALLHINLISEHHEGEVLRIVWAGLDEELIPPAVQRLEGLCAVYVIYEYTAVRTTVKRHTE